MRALVTGVSGFVGGHLTEHLLDSGDVVVGFSTSGQWPESIRHLDGRARIERLDLTSNEYPELTSLITRKQPEVIYHLAAQSNPRASMTDPRATWDLNLCGTLNFLEAVRHSGLKPRIVLVGSGICYGNPEPQYLPVDESCPLRPNNPYGASKAAADLLAIQQCLEHGTDIVIARPFNHSGPRQSATYVLGGLALQIAEVEAGLRDQLNVGNLDVVRDFTDVRDVVRAYRLLALHGVAGEIYNLGSGSGTRISLALDSLVKLARVPVHVHVDPARLRPVDLPLLVANPSKLREATGWKPGYMLEQTLADMLEYSRRLVRAPDRVARA
jgi:GDP-4-dehydro-6-deoxy-D-mannose reductase